MCKDRARAARRHSAAVECEGPAQWEAGGSTASDSERATKGSKSATTSVSLTRVPLDTCVYSPGLGGWKESYGPEGSVGSVGSAGNGWKRLETAGNNGSWGFAAVSLSRRRGEGVGQEGNGGKEEEETERKDEEWRRRRRRSRRRMRRRTRRLRSRRSRAWHVGKKGRGRAWGTRGKVEKKRRELKEKTRNGGEGGEGAGDE